MKIKIQWSNDFIKLKEKTVNLEFSGKDDSLILTLNEHDAQGNQEVRAGFEIKSFSINFAASHDKEKNSNIKGEIRIETSFRVMEEGAVVLSFLYSDGLTPMERLKLNTLGH